MDMLTPLGMVQPNPVPYGPSSAMSAQGGTRQHTTARGHRGMLPTEVCNAGRAASQHQPASPAAGTMCGCVISPSDAGHRMKAVGPEAAHRAALDPNITPPRCARGWFGRARALAREPRSHHRPSSGLSLSRKCLSSAYNMLLIRFSSASHPISSASSSL